MLYGDLDPPENFLEAVTGWAVLPWHERLWVTLTARLLHAAANAELSTSDRLSVPDAITLLTSVQTDLSIVLEPYSDPPRIDCPDELTLEVVEVTEQWKEQLGHPYAAALVARGLAGAVDHHFGDLFISWFRSHAEVSGDAGMPVPTQTHDPRRWLGQHRPNSQVDNYPDIMLDAVPHLRIVGNDVPVRLRVDLDSWYHLAPLGAVGDLSFAALQPNIDLAEFNHRTSTRGRFHNDGPIDAERQSDLVADLIIQVAVAGAQVVVLGEYTVTHEQQKEIRGRVDAADTQPLLVIGGTATGPSSGGTGVSNQAWWYIPGKRSASLEKVFDAVVNGSREDIDPGRELRVFLTDRWTIAVLICRDALSQQLLDELAKQRVNLLLVPAMSEKTGSLVASALSMRTRSQAFVVVANAPARWEGRDGQPIPRGERIEACFDGPYEHPIYAATLPKDAPPPADDARGGWVHRTGDRSTTWIDGKI